MEANLEKLLRKINLEKEKYSYFENGKLVKIVFIFYLSLL